MNRRRTNGYIDLGTLLTYALLSMAFSIGLIMFVAVIVQADILTWEPTMLISMFFLITGGFCGVFLLLK